MKFALDVHLMRRTQTEVLDHLQLNFTMPFFFFFFLHRITLRELLFRASMDISNSLNLSIHILGFSES